MKVQSMSMIRHPNSTERSKLSKTGILHLFLVVVNLNWFGSSFKVTLTFDLEQTGSFWRRFPGKRDILQTWWLFNNSVCLHFPLNASHSYISVGKIEKTCREPKSTLVAQCPLKDLQPLILLSSMMIQLVSVSLLMKQMWNVQELTFLCD